MWTCDNYLNSLLTKVLEQEHWLTSDGVGCKLRPLNHVLNCWLLFVVSKLCNSKNINH
jgi:hypothetical protein